MAEFISGTVNSTCFECAAPVEAKIPLVVDRKETPDLAKLVERNGLYWYTCPRGHTRKFVIKPDPSLLVFHFDSDTPFVYGAELDDPAKALGLLNMALDSVRKVLGFKWQDSWLKKGVPYVPRGLLAHALTNGLETVYSELEEGLDPGDVHYARHPEFRLPAYRLRSALRHYLETKEASALDAAIAVSDFILNHLNFDTAHSGLQADILKRTGQAYKLRYEATKSMAALNRSVFFYERAAKLTDKVSHLVDLAAILITRHQELGDSADLERAIEVCESAVRMSPDSPDALTALGVAIGERFSSGRDSADIKRTVDLFRQAVALTSEESADFFLRATNLGIALGRRYEVAHMREDLDEAIGILTKASETAPSDNADSLPVLSKILKARFIRTGNLADLDDAIEAARQAGAAAKGPSDQASCLNDFSAVLWERHQRLHRREDLQAAIEASRRSVALTPNDSPWRAARLHNLANSLQALFDYTSDLKDIDEAIAVFLEASADRPAAATLNNVANALANRYERTQNRNDIDRSIDYSRQAIELSPPATLGRDQFLGSHALSLQRRYELAGDPADKSAAIEAFRESCQQGLRGALEETLRSSRNWAEWATRRKSWEEAAEAGRYGLEALDGLFLSQPLRTQKEAWLKSAEGFHVRAAYALARSGDLPGAVVAMEQGSARMLAEALGRDPTGLERLEQIRPELAARYRHLVDQLTSLRAEEIRADKFSDQLRQALRDANHALDALIRDIRQVDGCEDFLQPADFERIREAARVAPLIYLMTTEEGGLALLVEADGVITAIWLPTLTEQRLFKRFSGGKGRPRANSYFGRYNGVLKRPGDTTARDRWLSELHKTTAWLWKNLMRAIVAALNDHDIGSAVLIPHGLLVAAPLHAAWTRDRQAPGEQRYALDNHCFTYAANANALLTAQNRSEAIGADTILAVDDPDGTLRYCNDEVIAAVAHFAADGRKVLGGMAARREAVMACLPDVNVVHFATHGVAAFIRPLESGLTMAHGDQLTLRDIFGLHLDKTRLAVLSACQTGMPGTWLLDEMVSLPTALTQAGVAGVVASLWLVDDASTMMLMFRFYEIWRKEHLQPAESLRRAQVWFRTTDDAQKRAYFKGFIPRYGGSGVAAKAAEAAYQYLMVRNPIARSNPYYWAAFGYTGL